MTLTVEWKADGQGIEQCDHEGTTEALNGSTSISACSACGKVWPTSFGAGVPTIRIVSKSGYEVAG